MFINSNARKKNKQQQILQETCTYTHISSEGGELNFEKRIRKQTFHCNNEDTYERR